MTPHPTTTYRTTGGRTKTPPPAQGKILVPATSQPAEDVPYATSDDEGSHMLKEQEKLRKERSGDASVGGTWMVAQRSTGREQTSSLPPSSPALAQNKNRYRVLAISDDDEDRAASPLANSTTRESRAPTETLGPVRTTAGTEQMWAGLETPPPIGPGGLDGDKQVGSRPEGATTDESDTTIRKDRRKPGERTHNQGSARDDGPGGGTPALKHGKGGDRGERADEGDNDDDGSGEGNEQRSARKGGPEERDKGRKNPAGPGNTIIINGGGDDDRIDTEPQNDPSRREERARRSLGPDRRQSRPPQDTTSGEPRRGASNRTTSVVIIPQKRPHHFSPQPDEDDRELPRLRLTSPPPPKSVRLPSFKETFRNPWVQENEPGNKTQPPYLFDPVAASTPRPHNRAAPSASYAKTSPNCWDEREGLSAQLNRASSEAYQTPLPSFQPPLHLQTYPNSPASCAMDVDGPDTSPGPSERERAESARTDPNLDSHPLLQRNSRDWSIGAPDERHETELGERRKKALTNVLDRTDERRRSTQREYDERSQTPMAPRAYLEPRDAPRGKEKYRPIPGTRAEQYLREREKEEMKKELGAGMETERTYLWKEHTVEHPQAPHPQEMIRGGYVRAENPAMGDYDRRVDENGAAERRPRKDDLEIIRAGRARLQTEEEEGEVLEGDESAECRPTFLDDQREIADETFTPIPYNGRGDPVIHHFDPEDLLRMATRPWMEDLWNAPRNTVIVVEIFNGWYTTIPEKNRTTAQHISEVVTKITGLTDFDVIPVEPIETKTPTPGRQMPTAWVIKRLTPRATETILHRKVYSLRKITIMPAPRSITISGFLFTLDGYLTKNIVAIEDGIKSVLRRDDFASMIAEMARGNQAFNGLTIQGAVERTVDSLRVEILELSERNFVANAYIVPPTRKVELWRKFVIELRRLSYGNYKNGVGRVRVPPFLYLGCKAADHPSQLCPFPNMPDWNGAKARTDEEATELERRDMEAKERIDRRQAQAMGQARGRGSAMTSESRRNDLTIGEGGTYGYQRRGGGGYQTGRGRGFGRIPRNRMPPPPTQRGWYDRPL
ncbi:hypothetical protein C8Q76DRAFT_793981 [Earliella scabrosa]|nr:hypothetical protein C8Q76DRAFT_793981 [Earliella scabrosa]